MHSSWLKENVFKKIKVVARSSSLIHDCWKPVWDFFKWYTVLWINACAVSCGKTTAACSTRRYIWDSNFSNHIVLEFILKKFRIQKNVDYPLGTDVLKSCFFNITTCLYTILGTYFASNSQDFSSCFSLLLFCAFFFFLVIRTFLYYELFSGDLFNVLVISLYCFLELVAYHCNPCGTHFCSLSSLLFQFFFHIV